MITMIRVAVIAPGKIGDALTFAHEISQYVKEKYGMTIEVLMPIGGNPSRIGWRIGYESMAQFESLMATFLADADYQKMIAKNSATFLPGSIHDEIWRSI